MPFNHGRRGLLSVFGQHLQPRRGHQRKDKNDRGCAPFRPSAPLSAAAVAAIIETIRVVIARPCGGLAGALGGAGPWRRRAH